MAFEERKIVGHAGWMVALSSLASRPVALPRALYSIRTAGGPIQTSVARHEFRRPFTRIRDAHRARSHGTGTYVTSHGIVVRIIAGKFAGRDLVSPRDFRVRPTAEHVRGAVLDMLALDLPKARVLDLFAGTGAVGLEALSRGAHSTDFVETRPSSLHSLKANIALLRMRDRTRVFKRDAVPFAAVLKGGSYDIAFVDPPYGSRMLDMVLESWQASRFARVLVLEHALGQDLPRGAQQRTFDETQLTIYRP